MLESCLRLPVLVRSLDDEGPVGADMGVPLSDDGAGGMGPEGSRPCSPEGSEGRSGVCSGGGWWPCLCCEGPDGGVFASTRMSRSG